MAYVGRPPSNATLSSADIADGIIVAADIGDDQVTGAKIENNPTIAGNLTVSGDIVPSTPLSNRNLIINGNFRINQRGKAARTTTSSAYNFDRWFWDGTYLYQGIEDVNVRNGTFTLGWTDSSTDITAGWILSTDSTAGDGPNSGLTYASISSGGQITVNEGTEYSKHLWIRFGGTVANLSKVQVEEGSSATPFEHLSYGDELARCQRYFEIAGGDFSGRYYTTTACEGNLSYLVDKRATPVITKKENADLHRQATGSVAFSVVSPQAYNGYSSAFIECTSGSPTGSTGDHLWAKNNFANVDAEL